MKMLVLLVVLALGAADQDSLTPKFDISALASVSKASKTDISVPKYDIGVSKSDISAAKSDNSLKSDSSDQKYDISALKPDSSASKRDNSASKSDSSALQSDTSALESDSSVSDSNTSQEETGGYQASQFNFISIPARASVFRNGITLKDDDDDDDFDDDYFDDDDDDDDDVDGRIRAGRVANFGFNAARFHDYDDDDNVPTFVGPQLPDITPEPLPPLKPRIVLQPQPQPLPQLEPQPLPEPFPEPEPEPEPVVIPVPGPLPLQQVTPNLPPYPPLPPVTPAVPIYRKPEPEYHSIPDYSYGYAIKDPYSGVDNTKEETRLGDRTEGSYSTVLSDGRRQIVTYWVDGDSGYNAKVTYEGVAHHPAPIAQKPAYAAAHDYSAAHDYVPQLRDDDYEHLQDVGYDESYDADRVFARNDYDADIGTGYGPDHGTGQDDGYQLGYGTGYDTKYDNDYGIAVVGADLKADTLYAEDLRTTAQLNDDSGGVFERTPFQGGYRYTGKDSELCRCYYAKTSPRF